MWRLNSLIARKCACVSAALAGSMKAVPKGTCTTPPLAATARASSSLMLRSKPGVKWRKAEWLAITGTVLSSMASIAEASPRWDTSTMMPSRFISLTTWRPNGLSPFHCLSCT